MSSARAPLAFAADWHGSMPASISSYIADDLTRRLGAGSGEELPELTLAALSRFYEVSLTPVREAVRTLVATGLLIKGGNGRLSVNPDAPRQPRPRRRQPQQMPQARPTDGPDRLEADLATELIRRSLRGETGYLREEATARRFGVGRTVIRQAFSRLAGRGLIEHVPRCGWRVRVFDAPDLIAYLETREALELKALELARPHLVESDLRRMLAGNRPRGASRPPRLDNQVHRYLVERAGNRYIRDFFERHGTYYTTLFDFAAPQTQVVARMARQHRAILRALIARDWPRARLALAHHIRTQQPIVQALMARISRNGG